jgi:hypothetical protein
MVAMAAGIGGGWLVAWNAAKLAHQDRNARLREFLPWALILLLIGALAIWVFLLPMEMRGNVLA